MNFSHFQYAYAISGGIGSGKSSACKILKSLGYAVIDADAIAHQTLQSKRSEVIKEFGEGILDGGEIVRAKLGKIVFNDKNQRKKLSAILSKGIRERIYAECVELEKKQTPFFVDIPLLFEEREIYDFSKTILVVCSADLQIQRVMQRNQLSFLEVQKRLKAQIPLKDKIPLAWQVIENEGSMQDLQNAIEGWVKSHLERTPNRI